MGEINNNIPPLEDVRELMLNDLRPYLLDPREDYPEPYYMLEYNGVPFSTLGGIQAISGQKKNGKSFVLTQLMAAILGDGSARCKENLAGLRVPERTIEHLGHQPKVLYVDTEMEKLNSAKVLRRVHWLCEWPMNEPQERFNVLWLRTVEPDNEKQEAAYKKRYRLIKEAIEYLEPDVVFIDGVRDIIGDFNDNKESAELVLGLMALAERRNICIWCALHMNPRPTNDDESKMRGHLGTELGNKVTDTLISQKKKEAGGVTFTVKQVDARGKDMDDWQFMVTDEAGGLGVPHIVSAAVETPEQTKTDDPADIRQWVVEGARTYEWPMTRSEVKERIISGIGKVKNHTRQQNDLNAAMLNGWLIETTLKKKGTNMLTISEEISRESEIPF